MGMHVKLAHKIGDTELPYELPCEVVVMNADNAVVQIQMAADGMSKTRTVQADQVYFKLEAA
jgi:hypothetical protein